MQWKRVDALHDLPHLAEEHIVFFAREYKIRGGYSAGETNQLILNFKKVGNKRGSTEWHYRELAVERFANELYALLNEVPCSIMAVPTSKAPTDPQYTNRFEDLFACLSSRLPQANFECPLALPATVLSAHAGGQRLPAELAKQYDWLGLKNANAELMVVVDDVLTTGGHFRAVHDCLRANGFRGAIVGACWARALL